jgi:hypothetical protein
MSFWMYLVALAGWTNPLILVFLPLSFGRQAVRARFAFALAILVCLMSTFVFFIFAPFVPLVGYFAWLIGILLIIFPAMIPATADAPGASGIPVPPHP